MDLSQDELFLFDPTLAEDVANLGLDDLGDLGVDLADGAPLSPPVSPRKVQDINSAAVPPPAFDIKLSSSQGQACSPKEGVSNGSIDPLPSTDLPSSGHVVGSDDQFLDAGLDIPAVQHQLLESCSPSVFSDSIPANPRPFPPIEKAHIPFFNGGSFFSDGNDESLQDGAGADENKNQIQNKNVPKLPKEDASDVFGPKPTPAPFQPNANTVVPCHVPSCKISPNAGIEAAHKATALLKASIPKMNAKNETKQSGPKVGIVGDGRLSPAARAVQLPCQDIKHSPASLAVQFKGHKQVNASASSPPMVFSSSGNSASSSIPGVSATSDSKPCFVVDAVSSSTSKLTDSEEAKRRRRAHRKDVLQQKKLQNRRKKALNQKNPSPVLSQACFPVPRLAPCTPAPKTAAAKEVTEIAQKLLQSVSSVQDPKMFFGNKPGASKSQGNSTTTMSGSQPDFVSSDSGHVPTRPTAGAKDQQLPVIPSLWRPPVPAAEGTPASATSVEKRSKKGKASKATKKAQPQAKSFGVVEKNGKKRRCNSTSTASIQLSATDAQVKEEEERIMAEANLPEGTDAESRRQRRLIRNRLSAALHRKRKRETLDNQKKMIEERDDIITDLRQEVERYSAKCDRLENDMKALTRYFGEAQISQILQRARSGALISDSPPHLVNVSTSGSDQSTCSEDADGFTATPPMSPNYEGSNQGTIPACPPNSDAGPANRKPAVVEGGKGGKKKRNLTVGLYPALATMAMCGILGRVAMPPGTMVVDPSQKVQDSAPVVALSAPEGRRRLQAVSSENEADVVEEASDDQVKEMSAIERWSQLNVEMIQLMMNLKDEDSGSDENESTSSSSVQRPWAISPMEMYPSLWTVDESSGTPWTVRRSFELFDFRALNEGSSTTTVPTTSTAVALPLRAPRSASTSLKMPSDQVVTSLPASDPVGSTASSRASLRGAASQSRKETPPSSFGQRGEVRFNSDVVQTKSVKVDEVFSSSVIGRAQSSRSRESSRSTGGAREGMAESEDKAVVAGSSYMFCPAASAFFSSGFLELAGLTGPADNDVFGSRSASEKEASSNGKYKMGARTSSKMKKEEPRNKTAIPGLGDQQQSDGNREGFFGSSFFTREKNDDTEAGGSTSSALVPTYLEYYRKKFFSAANDSNSSSGYHRTRSPIVKTVIGGEDPYMVILLPSSSIAGSGVSANASNGQGDGHDQGEKQQKWIELGCQIRSARVVEGVTFAGDPSAVKYSST